MAGWSLGVPRTAKLHPLPDAPVNAATALEWINQRKAPDGLRVKGRLSFKKPVRLPKDLSVDTLNLHDGHLPDGARVGRCTMTGSPSFGASIECGVLDLSHTNIDSIPDDLTVRDRLVLEECGRLTALPDGLRVGTLDLFRCRALEALPNSLSVAFLDLKGCDALRALPDDLTIRGGRLDLSDCAWIDRLPAGMGSMAQLDVSGCLNLVTLPDDLDVTAWIDIGGSGIEALPEQLRDTGLRWNGIPVTRDMVFNPQNLDPQQVLTERNAELRRVMMERYGYDRLMADTDAQTLDTDQDAGGERRLLRVAIPDDEDLVCVSVRCPSTGHHFMLRVPPTMRTCREAVAWTAGMDVDTYAPRVET